MFYYKLARLIYFVSLSYLVAPKIVALKQNYIWYFGDMAGLIKQISMLRNSILLLLVIFFLPNWSHAQLECEVITGALYGSTSASERGKSLAPTADNNGIYVAAAKDDSTLLMRVNLEGEIEWAKTFDFIPDDEEHISCIFLDSDGMLALSGMGGDLSSGGSIYAFRYNPNTHQVLWAKDYLTLATNYAFAMIQRGSGNYIMSNNPHTSTNNDSELLELDKNTGAVISAFSKNYHLGSSETIHDLVYDGNFLYGVGRYTDGPSTADMRNVLMKLDPNNGNQIWVKLGHVPGNLNARLYGEGLIIEQGDIYSIYNGDPAGTSLINNKIYVQKTSTDGTLLWLKQYELPGNTDGVWEMVASDGGIVILAAKKSAPKEFVLFKINLLGDVLWGKVYQFSSLINGVVGDRGISVLLEVGDHLVFTGTGTNPSGTTDLVLVITDLNGEVDMPCVTDQPLAIPAVNVSNPVFYTVNPNPFNVTPVVTSLSSDIIDSDMAPRDECLITDTIYTFLEAFICEGEVFEGYTNAGVYVDNFISFQGCDSVRTLDLNVSAPEVSNEQVEICLGEMYAGYDESGIYIDTFQNILGCDSIHTLALEVVPLEIFLNIQICDGEEYEGYTISGNYIDTLQSVINSCDTVRHLDLTVEANEETIIIASICEGEEYEGYSNTGVYVDIFQNAEGCDSTRTLDLSVVEDDYTEEEVTICLGEMYSGYSEAGIYLDTFLNSMGCDSFHTLTLEVEALEIDLSISICQGEEYDGYSTTGFYIDTLEGPLNDCDTIRYLDLEVNDPDETFIDVSICSGSNYEGYTETGMYVDVFVNANGCDSIRTLDLVVGDEIYNDIEADICPGQSYEGYADPGTYVDLYTTPSGCDSIRTLNLSVSMPEIFIDVALCQGGQFENYSEAGNYVDTLPGILDECDTTRYLNISIIPTSPSVLEHSICSGTAYLGYTATGIYIDSFQTTGGCDSIRILDLTVTDIFHVEEFITICEGADYLGHTESGVYIDTFTNASGCDSIRTLNLDINPALLTFINSSICEGQSFLGYSSSGLYADTFQTATGCDSIRTLNLTVSDIIEQTISAEICPGQLYEGYSQPGFYTDTFNSVFGCDSIRYLMLSVALPESFHNAVICSGEQFENYSVTGFYLDTIPGPICDTVRYLSLTVTPPFEHYISQSICKGQLYEGYDTTGTYLDTFKTTEGCDSIRLLNLIVSDEIITYQEVQICLGDNYNGYTTEGLIADTLNASFGCDSIIRTQLTVVAAEKQIEISICEGTQFETYTEPGLYIDTIQSPFSLCDTIRYLNLIVKPTTETFLQPAICDGEDFEGYTSTGTYIDTLVSVDGCDSIRMISLEVENYVSSNIQSSVCDGSFEWINSPGTYIDTLESVIGCDSIRTIVLTGAAKFIPNVFSPNADGINDDFIIYYEGLHSESLVYFGIFDRFGDMAYQTDEWPVKWDGKRLNGEIFQSGVFAYVFIYECGDKRIVEHGNITLVD